MVIVYCNLSLRVTRWFRAEEIKNFNWDLMSDNSDKGYVLEADLPYLPHLHDLHNGLPFCPENIPPNEKF